MTRCFQAWGSARKSNQEEEEGQHHVNSGPGQNGMGRILINKNLLYIVLLYQNIDNRHSSIAFKSLCIVYKMTSVVV